METVLKIITVGAMAFVLSWFVLLEFEVDLMERLPSWLFLLILPAMAIAAVHLIAKDLQGANERRRIEQNRQNRGDRPRLSRRIATAMLYTIALFSVGIFGIFWAASIAPALGLHPDGLGGVRGGGIVLMCLMLLAGFAVYGIGRLLGHRHGRQ